MDNRKLINTAKNIDIIAKFVDGFMFAFAIVFVIFAVLVLLLGEKMFAPGSITLDIDFIKLYLADNYQVVTDALKLYVIMALVIGSMICLAIHYALKYLRNILSPMKEGRPFEKDVPVNLKKIAWIILISGALMEIISVIERLILTKAYPLEEVFSSVAVSKIEYTFTMDFNFIITFCIIMFLSYIFEYGIKLQIEADETL